MNFGEQIKTIRKERNLTQQDMADMLSVSRQAVSNWENDKNLPDIEMLIIMSQVFHLTLDELILGGTKMNNMTEKLIKDTSTSKRIKMSLTGVIIGSALMLLGLSSLVIGSLLPETIEKYWGAAFSCLMLGGVIAFLVTGIRNGIEVIKDRTNTDKRLPAIGGALMVAGIIAYGLSLVLNNLSGLFGIVGIAAGIITIIIAAIKSGKAN